MPPPSLEDIALRFSAITMNNAATWNDDFSARAEANRKPASRRVFFMLGLILAATAGLSAWVYFYSKSTIHDRAVQVEMRWGVGGSEASVGLLKELDQVAFRVAVIGLAGGVVTLIAFSLAVQKNYGRTWRFRAARAKNITPR